MTVDRRTVILASASLAAAGASEAAAPEPAATAPSTPPERVLGIGGFFFRSPDPKALAQWYQQHLGVDPVPTGPGQKPWQAAGGKTAFAPFSMKTDYFEPAQGWMINFRVRDLDAMAAQLRAAGIEVKFDPAKTPYGRFGRLHDPDGNPIELWEAPAAA